VGLTHSPEIVGHVYGADGKCTTIIRVMWAESDEYSVRARIVLLLLFL
jgi:hypothetical protein